MSGASLRRAKDAPLWQGYAAAALVLLFVYFCLRNGSAAQTGVYELFSVAAPLAIVVGILRYRPARPRHWWLFAGALGLWALGDTYWDSYRWFTEGQAPYPSPADIAYIGAYPVFVAGLFALTRGWGRPRIGDLLDGAIVVVAGAVLTLLVLLEPTLAVGGSSAFVTSLAVAAPVGDLLLLVGLMQLVFRRRAGNFALRAVMVAVASTLVADAIYSYLNLKGAYTSGMLVDAGWLIANAAWAVAALHPSMRSIRSIPEQMREGLSVLRIALLVGALLATPVALIVDSALGERIQALQLGIVGVTTTILVGARVVLLQRERKQAQEALADSEQRYRELFREADDARRTLAAQNDQLRQLDQLKDDLVALVSHELRTPLTSIVGYIDLVCEDEGGLTEEQRSFLGVARKNSDRLLSLVSDLLFVAEVQAGRLTLQRESLNLADLVSECVSASRPTAKSRSIDLSFRAEAGVVVDGDRQRLAQVIDNLLSNALKFTPPGGSIEVAVLGSGDSAAIEVADTGIGIAPGDQQALFTRFFRTRSAMSKAIQGTGLGLSIVKAIVEGHGGAIGVESTEGAGATFRVELPAVVALEEAA